MYVCMYVYEYNTQLSTSTLKIMYLSIESSLDPTVLFEFHQ